MTKAEIRSFLRQERKKITADHPHTLFSRRAQENLMASPVWVRATTVLLYQPIRDEVDTALLHEDAWRHGKEVYLPRCLPGSPGNMEFLSCASAKDLLLSDKGIPEPPAANLPLSAEKLAEALLVVPGLGFDRQGYRIGYGGGYYDRLLAHAHGPTIGLTFEALILDFLPAENWDRPVKALCTEVSLTWI